MFFDMYVWDVVVIVDMEYCMFYNSRGEIEILFCVIEQIIVQSYDFVIFVDVNFVLVQERVFLFYGEYIFFMCKYVLYRLFSFFGCQCEGGVENNGFIFFIIEIIIYLFDLNIDFVSSDFVYMCCECLFRIMLDEIRVL